MSVIITNISVHDGSIGISDYVVRINNGPAIARFSHWRHEGLAKCLRNAADAVEASGHPNPFERILRDQTDRDRFPSHEVEPLSPKPQGGQADG